jgi:hypothetical protein
MLVCALYGAEPAPPACPKFTETKLSESITQTDRFATFAGGIVGKVSQLTIDTDGASTAYHPDNIGSSELCVGMQVFDKDHCLTKAENGYARCETAVKKAQAVHWDRVQSPAFCVFGFEAPSSQKIGDKNIWGGAKYGSGPLPIQGATDPAPGFFVSTTPRKLVSAKTGRAEYANADIVPFVVATKDIVGKNGSTRILAPAAIVHLPDGRSVAALVGDSGGAIGEVSVAAAQLIQDPKLTKPVPVTLDQLKTGANAPFPYTSTASGRLRATRNPDRGTYLLFLFSGLDGLATEYSMGETERITQAALSGYGGISALTRCASAYFESTK